MSLKVKILICVVALATAFAIGRFTVPEKIKEVVKVVEVEKKVIVKEKGTTQEKKMKTVIVEVTRPDGTKEKTTTITEDTQTATETSSRSDTETKTDTTKETEIVRGNSKVTVSALAGIKVTRPQDGMVFGASLTKPILGPVTLGAFGFTDGRAGVSIGLSF